MKGPVGLAHFLGEPLADPWTLAAYKYHDIVQYTYMPRGGHFAALEEPELLARDVRMFIKKLHARN